MIRRPCRCGCGRIPTLRSSRWLPGHNRRTPPRIEHRTTISERNRPLAHQCVACRDPIPVGAVFYTSGWIHVCTPCATGTRT